MKRAEIIEVLEIIKEDYEEMPVFAPRLPALKCAIEILKQPEQKEDKWIPIRTRLMDEDERKEWSEKLGYELEDYEGVIYMPPLPDDDQDVLICLRNGLIMIDTFERDHWDGCYFYRYDIDDVVAWMPLPNPWEGEE